METLVKSNGHLFPTLPSLLDEMFTRDFFDWSNLNQARANSLPAVNIKETENSFELEVAAPGMTKNDFKVELNNDKLFISAEQENQEEENKEENYTRREFSYRSFTRAFNLPEQTVNGENISATYTDGVLYITVPKAEEAKVKPPRQIEIK